MNPVTENAKLITGKPMAVREFFTVDRQSVEAIKAEADGGARLYKAKVFQTNKPLQNPRIYPREVMESNVKRLKTVLGDGYLAGSVDHASYFSAGNLGDTVIIWRDLKIDEDGAGIGQFEVIEGHSKGKDFLAQIEAKLAIGFSTYGYGSAHEPSEEERKKYKLSKHDCVVIMDENYVLRKIDAVDDPSCEDARLLEATEIKPMDPIKTLEDLKTVAPEAYALHEAAVKALNTQLDSGKTAVKTLVEALNLLLPKLTAIDGIALPKVEVHPAEMNTRIQTLETALAAEQAKVKAEQDKHLPLQAQIDAHAAEKADADRKAKAGAKLTEGLKDAKFDATRKAIVAAAQSNLNDKTFTEASVDAFVTAKVAEYANLAKPTDVKPGLTGKDVGEEQVGDGETTETASTVARADRDAIRAYGEANKRK